jgi:hypothetical protein
MFQTTVTGLLGQPPEAPFCCGCGMETPETNDDVGTFTPALETTIAWPDVPQASMEEDDRLEDLTAAIMFTRFWAQGVSSQKITVTPRVLPCVGVELDKVTESIWGFAQREQGFKAPMAEQMIRISP